MSGSRRAYGEARDARAWTWLVIGGVASLQLVAASRVRPGRNVRRARVRSTVSAPRRLRAPRSRSLESFGRSCSFGSTSGCTARRRRARICDTSGKARSWILARPISPCAFACSTRPCFRLRRSRGPVRLGRRARVRLGRRCVDPVETSPFSALVVVMPLVLATIASALGAYPVMDRLLLFAAPLTLVAYASLVAWAVEQVPERSRMAALAGAAAAVALAGARQRTCDDREAGVLRRGQAGRGRCGQHGSRRRDLRRCSELSAVALLHDRLGAARQGTSALGASIAGQVGLPTTTRHRGDACARADATVLCAGRYRGRTEIVGLPTGRQYVTSDSTLDPAVQTWPISPCPLRSIAGWAELEVRAHGDRRRGSDAGCSARTCSRSMVRSPALVAALQQRGVRLVMERRQGRRSPTRSNFLASPRQSSSRRGESHVVSCVDHHFQLTRFLGSVGQVAEWLKAPVSKTGIPFTRYREFESLPVRCSDRRSVSRVSARRGGAERLTVVRRGAPVGMGGRVV